jgi:hypothetical protein
MHVHSEWSYDGHLPLNELASLFRRRRYDVVFMCEHDRGFNAERWRAYGEACAHASAEGALLIPGIEYADPEDRVHVPVWGAVPFLGEGVATSALLDAAREHGGVSVLAHPVRRDAWQVFERAWLELASGIEIWTRKWDGWAPNRWALREAAAHGLVGTVALDLHRSAQTFPLSMELDLDGPPNAVACVNALGEGRCRARIGRVDVAHLDGALTGSAVRRAERLRRPLWRAARKLRDKLVS